MGLTAASPARRAAALAIADILGGGRSLEQILAAAPYFADLEGRDRAFARAIVSTTLRRLGTIDAALRQRIARPIPPSAMYAQAILQTALAQLRHLGVPPHAAVSDAVTLAQTHPQSRPFKGLINAVLRRLTQEPAAPTEPGADLPAWLATRWRAAHGAETAEAMFAALLLEPPLDLTLKTGEDAQAWAERLDAELTPTGSLRLRRSADVPNLPGYAEGVWWVQDAAAALPARLLGPLQGKRALDLCCAPGGKTMQLIDAGAEVTGVDVSQSRLDRTAENLARAGMRATLVRADILEWRPDRPFEAVLLDAPCTATGTLRRRPDVAWLRRPADIARAAEAQSALLHRAVDFTAPGGKIVYAVCSLEPEEGEGVVSRVIAARQDVRPAGERLRTTPADWPEIGGRDGFFAQVLERVG